MKTEEAKQTIVKYMFKEVENLPEEVIDAFVIAIESLEFYIQREQFCEVIHKIKSEVKVYRIHEFKRKKLLALLDELEEKVNFEKKL